MAGNKHKNGIICVFPGCEKKMRTQKFKGHFIKLHLKEGEEYSVDHRRQFEVAQAEPTSDMESSTLSAGGSPDDAAAGVKVKSEATAPSAYKKQIVADFAKRAAEVDAAAAAHAAMATAVELNRPLDEMLRVAAAIPPTSPAAAIAPSPVPAANRNKRPATAITPEVVPSGVNGTGDSTAVTAEVASIVDRRFNELSMKIDEVLENQRQILSVLAAVDTEFMQHLSKKRKETATTVV